MPINFADKSAWNSAFSQINNMNVATVGEVNQILSNIGATVNYGSQGDLGKRLILTEAEMTASGSLYVLSTGQQLYGGIYQLVQVDSGATAANISAGRAAFLLTTATSGATGSGATGYVVTDEANTLALTQIIGVFLNAVTPGNFCFVQVHGRAPVKYRATVTATTAGSAIMLTGAGDGTFDAPTQSGNPTFLQLHQIVGTAISNPANAAVGTMQMRILQGRY
jgi:hypothetical protein